MIKQYVESIRTALKDRNLKEVSRNVEMSYFTLHRFANANKEMSVSNLIKVDEYLNGAKDEVKTN